MKPITTFSEANDYLQKFESNFTSYNLNNIKTMMDYLDNPQDKVKVVHVAGTSGKTSTSYFIAKLLVSSGKLTGLTVSPALDQVNERVQINLSPLSETEYIDNLNKFINLLSNLEIKPSRFEFMVAFAYWYFAEKKVDYAVIEVGLGGLNDATNIIHKSNKVCVITDIGYDHMNILGDTLSMIAFQKAGIILPGNQVFMHKQTDEVVNTIKARSKEIGAKLTLIEEDADSISNLADYQQRNWQLAYAAYEFISERDHLPSLDRETVDKSKFLQVPGRMDVKKYKNKTIILDGAHNPQKMSAFISSFKKLYPGVRPSVLLAIKSTKDYENIAKRLDELASKIVLTSFKGHGGPRSGSLATSQLKEAFGDVETVSIDDPKTALETLLASNDEIIVITGSLYLISELRSTFEFLK